MHEAKMTLCKAIRIGELLVAEKRKLKHGGWLAWCEANLVVDQRTARRYAELFRNQAYLKSDSVTDLTSAYGMLSRRRKLIAEGEIKGQEYHKQRVATLMDWPPPLPPTFEGRCELCWQRVYCAIKGYFGCGGFEPQERQAVLEFLARKLTEEVSRTSKLQTKSSVTVCANGEKLSKQVPLINDELIVTNQWDQEMRLLADRHYSRRTVGATQFLYSGRKLVIRNWEGTMLFGWMFPDPDKRDDSQVGYNCAIFRNETNRCSSTIIRDCVQLAFEKWGPNRCYTYVDPKEILSGNPGYCFKCAGWRTVRRADGSIWMSSRGLHLLALEFEGDSGS